MFDDVERNIGNQNSISSSVSSKNVLTVTTIVKFPKNRNEALEMFRLGVEEPRKPMKTRGYSSGRVAIEAPKIRKKILQRRSVTNEASLGDMFDGNGNVTAAAFRGHPVRPR